jgi:hypothetical protein
MDKCAAHMREITNAYNISVGKPEGRKETEAKMGG